jgi:hypothetical protein
MKIAPLFYIFLKIVRCGGKFPCFCPDEISPLTDVG